MAIEIPFDRKQLVFVLDFASGGTFFNPSANWVITLSPPAGKRVRLTVLAATSDIPSVTITVGGATAVDAKTLTASTNSSDNDFTIGIPSGGAGMHNYVATYPSITGGVDEAIVISANDNGASVLYSYETGEVR